MNDPVRCRAEHSYPGEPLEVWFEERWRTVTEVLEESYTPAGMRYHVVCEEALELWLTYDPHRDNWQVPPAAWSASY